MNIKLLASLFFLLFVTFVSGCKKDDEKDYLAGDWSRKSDFEGVSRSDAVVFVIDDEAYVGTGFTSSTNTNENRLVDFWKYQRDTDNWYSLAAFPGKARSKAVAFAVNGKGYVGLGTDGSEVLFDFWEYNPASNAWVP